MLRIRLVIPALALLTAVGCGGGDSKPSEKPTTSTGSSTTAKSSGTKSSAAKELLATTGTGTVKGKVVFDGDPPKSAPLDMNKDTEYCHKDPDKSELNDQTWRIGPDKGVANVIVWVQAPENKYFKIPDDQKHAQPVTIDQPFCAFEPHVFVLYPSYFDGKKQESTGQVLTVKNSATITHNSNLTFGDPILNTGGGNNLLGPGKDIVIKDILPCKEKDCSKSQDLNVTCNVHQWMKAFGKVFDHPYVAVSSGGKKDDKTFGEYEIKNVPAGAEVSIMYWHESMSKPAELKKITLKEGENKLDDIKVKK